MASDTAVSMSKLGDLRRTDRHLRRNWRFQALWLGCDASSLGVSAADFAYPVVVLLITCSPALDGLFGFIQMAATTLAELRAGTLVARELGHLAVAQLFVVVAALGAVTPFGA